MFHLYGSIVTFIILILLINRFLLAFVYVSHHVDDTVYICFSKIKIHTKTRKTRPSTIIIIYKINFAIITQLNYNLHYSEYLNEFSSCKVNVSVGVIDLVILPSTGLSG